jgi:type 2 lantibiotic biosynthesis protein LanM
MTGGTFDDEDLEKGRISDFAESLIVRAATIDEILSSDFEPLPGQKEDADLAARRLAAWCRSCASGDWALFNQRLERDGLSLARVLERFATVRRSAGAVAPAWIDDAIWIDAALRGGSQNAKSLAVADCTEPCPFQHLFAALIGKAQALLWAEIDAGVFDQIGESGHASLRHLLRKELTSLCAPALYERFGNARRAAAKTPDAREPECGGATSSLYERFIAEMNDGGFHRLFEDKPVLLRLIAALTRQWIEATRELVLRLGGDLAAIRRQFLNLAPHSKVAKIEGDLSDRHNGGRSVRIITFEDGSRVVYKPKDLRLDVAWRDLVERLNRVDAPVELKAVRAIARDGYGWTEFIDHTGCADEQGCKLFFRRAGAWLALFHACAGTDMHQENIIAAGDHPVPIDLEMLFQAGAEDDATRDAEAQAFEVAIEMLGDSVMSVGLLPNYIRSVKNNIVEIGGMNSRWQSKKIRLTWNDINTDNMRPANLTEAGSAIPNLPHVGGRYAKFGDHIEGFVAGFEDYAKFLLRRVRQTATLFDGFAGLPVRKIVRPTRFYAMLLQRLKNHRSMADGVLWSAQADFLARLADWEKQDAAWPLLQAERSALLALNVPHLMSPSDGNEISDAAGISIRTDATSGMDRAQDRIQGLDENEIAWQIEVIRQNTITVSKSPDSPRVKAKQLLYEDARAAPTPEVFVAQADQIAKDLAKYAIRRGPGAAWLGLDWMGDAEVVQLVPLGPELYNGVSGIAVFLAAHAAVTGSQSSRELALAAISYLRKSLRSRNAARMARLLGIGGFCGLGSIAYGLTVIRKCLGDDELLADACAVAELFSDDLIAADQHLDVLNGSAGAILALLRLYRDTQSGDVLRRAVKCGEHLLSHGRAGSEGRRTWTGQGISSNPINGMSHGAAGFAYALAALSAATRREDFAAAAAECIAFEDSSYSAEHSNWPDLRRPEPAWPSQWCHGAAGIGLARIAMTKRAGLGSKVGGRLDGEALATDIRRALEGEKRRWPSHFDTLCCGTLGGVELFCEAADALGQSDLRERAARRLMAVVESAAAAGDYRWNSGKRKFNLGLFRGVAGVGYTLLRQVDRSLPNILILD